MPYETLFAFYFYPCTYLNISKEMVLIVFFLKKKNPTRVNYNPSRRLRFQKGLNSVKTKKVTHAEHSSEYALFKYTSDILSQLLKFSIIHITKKNSSYIHHIHTDHLTIVCSYRR